MDGVFMKKIFGRIVFCAVFAVICWSALLIADRQTLDNGLIRFHVVAHSDSQEDQTIKLSVRDAVLESIQSDLQKVADIQEAKNYIQRNLPKIQRIADQTLQELGFHGSAKVSMCKEAFHVRNYDTFSLPSGVYDSLRIVIGNGEGKNWWCVSFPTLCISATVSEFEDTAVSAGFSKPLVKTLTGKEAYELRFYLLDQLGKLENILFHG